MYKSIAVVIVQKIKRYILSLLSLPQHLGSSPWKFSLECHPCELTQLLQLWADSANNVKLDFTLLAFGSDLLVFYPHTLSELFYVTCFTCVVLWWTGTNQEQFTAIIHVKL